MADSNDGSRQKKNHNMSNFYITSLILVIKVANANLEYSRLLQFLSPYVLNDKIIKKKNLKNESLRTSYVQTLFMTILLNEIFLSKTASII